MPLSIAGRRCDGVRQAAASAQPDQIGSFAHKANDQLAEAKNEYAKLHAQTPLAAQSCSQEESSMTSIATPDLRAGDVPQGDFNWPTFSRFTLTFDPLWEPIGELDQVPAKATPSGSWTPVALRYFLYCWQRIGNNQGGLRADEIEKVQAALSILRTKLD